MLDTLSCSYTSISFLTTSCSLRGYFVTKCNVDLFLQLYTSIFFLTTSCSFRITLCLSVMLDTLSCSYTSTSKGDKHVINEELSYYNAVGLFKSFDGGYLRERVFFTLCLSVMLDTLSCSYTSTFFLTTSCSFTLLCV